MKNKLILIAVILACFIPTAVAYSSYRKTQNAPVDEKTAVSIAIDDMNGKNTTLVKQENGDAADQIIRFFLNMRKNAQPITTLPASVISEKCYKITISTKVRDDSAEYYFSPDPTTCYLRASDGSAYRIAEADAASFIQTQFAESIYEASAVPVLSLSGGNTVRPDRAVWQYKNYTGDYVDADVTGLTTSSMETYDLQGGLNLSFDLPPDYCSVHIADGDGTVLFDDVLANLSAFRQSGGGSLEVDVIARWYEDPSRSFCGELSYSFLSFVAAPAEFYFASSYLESGKFTAITGVNVEQPELVAFATEIPNAETPVFHDAGGEKCVGFLAIPPETPSGLYSVTFTYGGTTQESTFEVVNGGDKSSVYYIDASVIDTCRTEAALAEFESLCQEVMNLSSEERYFDGYFLEGPTGDFTLLRGFGRSIFLNDSVTSAYRSNGVDYSAPEGTAVMAGNAGKVVYSGNLVHCGNIVVIEHGWGLKTWYYNMGSVTVKEGDMVSRGDTIGTAGMTGFSSEMGVHTAMSVGHSFVSPYDTWADSSEAGKVLIARIDE